MSFFGQSAYAFELADQDMDTRIYVDKNFVDDDTIRFDLGGATPIENAITISQTDGFQWNPGNDDIDFALHGANDMNVLFMSAEQDGVAFGGTITYWERAGATINSKFLGIKPDRPRWNAGAQILYSEDTLRATDFSLIKARGTVEAPEILEADDIVSNLRWEGHDGVDFHVGAVLRVQVDGTPAEDDVQMQYRFLTWDGTTTSSALTIRADRSIGMGTNTPSEKLDVQDGNINTNQEVQTFDKVQLTKHAAMLA